MGNLPDHPVAILVISLVTMWGSAQAGWLLLRRRHEVNEQEREDFGLVLTASLTLLGLIVGFSFSMATNRYDQRKNFEEGEANAIGTAYVRARLLPAADGAKVQALLRRYLAERIRFYESQDEKEVREIDARVAGLQGEMWEAIVPSVTAQPTPVAALVAWGMNDVLNSQGYTQSAWWYRLPQAAWGLMIVVGLVCNLLIGYLARGGSIWARLLLILPLLIAVSFMFIADIDSPRHGLIRVKPQNLISVAESVGGK